MSATTDLVDAMNDDLTPVEEVKETVEEVKDEPKEVEAVKEKDEQEADPDEDDGYVIDDEPEEPEKKEEVEPAKPASLNTEQQYIYDNLPTLTVSGKDGKVYNIKVPNELPADFEFASSREQSNFFAAVASQELKANTLQQQFQGDATAKSAEEFATKEDRATTEDIASLQKSGELSKFKKQPSDPDFDTDPTAMQVQAVINFMNEKNEAYLKRSQAGQAYRHIGFEEAFYAYKRANPEKARSTAQQDEDTQRKAISRNVSSKGTAASAAKSQGVRSGTQTRDIYAMIDNLDI